MNLSPVQTRFLFDFTEIIATEYLPTGQLHSLGNGQPCEKKPLTSHSDRIQGRPTSKCAVTFISSFEAPLSCFFLPQTHSTLIYCY